MNCINIYRWGNQIRLYLIRINISMISQMLTKIQQFMTPVFEIIKQHPKLSIALAISACIVLLIRRQQGKMIYFPQIQGMPKSPSQNPHPYRNPQQFGFANSQIIQIKTKDNTTLRGWYISHQNNKPQRLILYYHENAGNIGTRLPFIKRLIENTQSDVMIVAYRGYSDSEGKPSQSGIKKDGIQILNKAIQQANQRNLPLVVLGRSLGGAVAINSCSKIKDQDQVKGLVLQNTFTSISDVAVNIFGSPFTRPIIRALLLILLSNHWESYKLIGSIRPPTLFIKSALDELIPMKQMDQLQKLSKATNRSYVIKRGTHNQSWSLEPNEYFSQLNRFFSSL